MMNIACGNNKTLCGVLFIFALAAEAQSVGLPAVQAQVETVQEQRDSNGSLVTKTETSLYYRDTAGRIRIEQGPIIRIMNPVDNTLIVFDRDSETATVFELPKRQNSESIQFAVPSIPKDRQRVGQDLGGSIIDDRAVNGTKYIYKNTVTDANGKVGEMEGTVEVWFSFDYMLPVLTKIDMLFDNTYVTYYRQIRLLNTVSEDLFKIPKYEHIQHVKLESK